MTEELCNRQSVEVIARKFQGTLAPDRAGIVIGKGRETIHKLKDPQIGTRRCEAIQATHRLVVLVKASNHQFGGVVGFRDQRMLQGIDQLGEMAFQTVEKGRHGWGLRDTALA